MSDLVGNPEDRFSHNEAHISCNVVKILEKNSFLDKAGLRATLIYLFAF